MRNEISPNPAELNTIQDQIYQNALALGFDKVGFSNLDLHEHVQHYKRWLKKKYHGSMGYMEESQHLRSDPSQLREGTLSIISVRLNYLPADVELLKRLKQRLLFH